jgi:hypothetical protein
MNESQVYLIELHIVSVQLVVIVHFSSVLQCYFIKVSLCTKTLMDAAF